MTKAEWEELEKLIEKSKSWADENVKPTESQKRAEREIMRELSDDGARIISDTRYC